MRVNRYVIVSAALLIAAPTALASTADAATTPVLTYGSTGGTAVASGDVLQAGLGTSPATLYSSATDPTAPGTATESLTGQTFGSCTPNILGVSSVSSVTVNDLPFNASINDSDDVVTISEASSSAPLETTVVLSTLLGTVTCVYTASSITGTASNTAQTITFTNQKFTLSTGPGTCFSAGFFSASYGPVLDTTVSGSPKVFVN
jgi:hypothetical protein